MASKTTAVVSERGAPLRLREMFDVPAVEERMLPVVVPETSVAAAGWVSVSRLPRSEVNATATPDAGFPWESVTTAVMVEVVLPSAGIGDVADNVTE